MKKDIILAGVGGQGILSIAAVIDIAALHENLKVKQAEVHGMSQRGGAVQSHLRISSENIYSDLIPKGNADIILSVEPLESLRYLPFLANNGWIISSVNTYENIPNYPQNKDLSEKLDKIDNKILIDSQQIAKQAGSLKTANMVMLGAAVDKLGISIASFEKGISELFEKKGLEIVEMNIKAVKLGMEAAGKY